MNVMASQVDFFQCLVKLCTCKQIMVKVKNFPRRSY
jgi:hypothetical protein